MTEEILHAAIQEIAAKRLPKIAGFQANVDHRVLLVGLKPGAWIGNAERSRERLEVMQEISYEIYEGVRLTLERLIPGKIWKYEWYADLEGAFVPGGSVMSFRWSDS